MLVVGRARARARRNRQYCGQFGFGSSPHLAFVAVAGDELARRAAACVKGILCHSGPLASLVTEVMNGYPTSQAELETARKAYQKTAMDLAKLRARVGQLDRLIWLLTAVSVLLAIGLSLVLARAIWHLARSARRLRLNDRIRPRPGVKKYHQW
jgi:hypothetical protein